MMSTHFITLIANIGALSAELSDAAKYEILRDVVLIVFAAFALIAALLGALLFFSLRAGLERDIIKKASEHIDRECGRLRGQAAIRAGLMFWVGKMYDRAIEHTRRGLREAENLLDETEVIWAKSNLGYYLAEKHRQQASWDLKEESIALTKIGYDKYNTTIAEYNKADWVDNYIFARAIFVSTIEERTKLLALINTLVPREDLQAVKTFLEESRQHALTLSISN